MKMARRHQEIRARLLATFRAEAEEHLAAITAGLARLEGALPAPEAAEVVAATFRAVHTLKGAARSVSVFEVEAVCQAMEAVLSRATRGDVALHGPLLAQLQQAADAIGCLLEGRRDAVDVAALTSALERAAGALLEPAGPPGNASAGERAAAADRDRPMAPPAAVDLASGPAQAPSPPPQAEPLAAPPDEAAGLPSADTVRVAAVTLDELFAQVEELLFPKLTAAERVAEARALLAALAQCRAAVPDGAGPALRAVEVRARALLEHLAYDAQALARAIDALQDVARGLRLSPVGAALAPLARMARELAREQGKEVALTIEGADLEVDRKIVDALKDPLVHLVRNAVDHGIEPPAARQAAGKPPRGRVTLAFRLRADRRLEVRVEDDGRGIDLDQVRAAAVRARLLTEAEARALRDDEALALIYRAGVSTSPIITRLSGHGLGMAIVKERVEGMGGALHLESVPGQGTVFRLRVPTTVATFRGLLVCAGGQPYLLPLEAVDRVVRCAPEALCTLEGRPSIRWDDQLVPVADLAALLDLPTNGARDRLADRPCVLVRAGEACAALVVDEVVGDREVLVKDLRPPLVRLQFVASAGLLGTGRLVLVLRPTALVRACYQVGRLTERPAAQAPAAARPPVILVVDDSITTRVMEKNLLEAAGYQVRVAVDGAEAWMLLKTEPCDLVVSDVDMPRLDGFELTARIRADPALAELPVVLVTALESREDKERGIAVGANAYVIKSSFDQSDLLEIIRRLL
jgi:two-component system chemotaxis sensor kinase CheA